MDTQTLTGNTQEKVKLKGGVRTVSKTRVRGAVDWSGEPVVAVVWGEAAEAGLNTKSADSRGRDTLLHSTKRIPTLLVEAYSSSRRHTCTCSHPSLPNLPS